MELNVAGLVSGFDWKSMVDQLSDVERAPQRRMRVEQHTIYSRNSAYTSLKSQLTSLKTTAETLKDTDLYDSRTVTSSESHVTATADAGTSSGDYRFEIYQMATSAKQLGATDVGAAANTSAAISASGLSIPISAGTVTVQGAQVTVDTDNSLTTTLDAIKTAVGGSFDYSISGDKVTLTDSSTIVLGSASDTSNFLQALRLSANGTTSITSSDKLGGIDLSQSMDAANLTDGAGTASGEFSINGTSITYASTDSINNILGAINNSEANVYANYDPVNDRFLLTNKTEGDVGITISDTSGDFLAKTRLLSANSGDLSRGNNLIYKVNDTGPLVSQGNAIDQNSSGIQGLTVTATKANGAARISSVDTSGETVTTENSHGYSTGDTVTLYSPGTIPGGLSSDTTYYVKVTSNTTFSLHTSQANAEAGTSSVDLTGAQSGDVYFLNNKPTTTTVSIQSDTTKIKNSIAALVSELNKIQSMITALTASSTDADGKVTLGVLASEPMATEISRELRSKGTEDVSGITNTIKRMESIGYTTSGYTNQITLDDESKLDSALRDNLGQVNAIFTTTTYGIADSLYTYLDNLLDDDGSLATTQENMTGQITDIDKQIADHERRVQSTREALIRSFVSMETAQSKINQQMSFLATRFNNVN
jgi:flagellar hook-associated protein 2